MDGLNEVKLIGRVGKDVDLRHIDDERKVAKVVIATNKTFKKQDGEKETKTDWHEVEFWNKKAQLCADYVKKGMKVYVSGELRNDTYEKDGVKHFRNKIVGSEIMFLSDRTQSATNSNNGQANNGQASNVEVARQQSQQYVAQPSVTSENFVSSNVDEDLPF